jgi:hypothetical protein
MTIFMNLHAMDSTIHPAKLLPGALLPYVVLAVAARSARTFPALTFALVTMLLILGVGFWIYYDGLFIRYTTLNAPLFFEVPVLQFVVILLGGALGWWYARRKGMKDKTPTS